jgi:hypothetical protein
MISFQLPLHRDALLLQRGHRDERRDQLVDRYAVGFEVAYQLEEDLLDPAQEVEEFGSGGHEHMFAYGCDSDALGKPRAPR